MKILKIFAAFFKWFLIFFVLSLTTLATFLSFDKGKQILVNTINANFNSGAYTVEIKSLTSFFPLVLSIEHIDLKEKEKTWLALQGVAIELDIGSFLLTQSLTATLTGKELSLTDLPTAALEKTVTNEDIIGKSLPVRLAAALASFKNTFSTLNLKIDLRRFHIGSNIIGQDVDLALEGISLKYDANQDQLSVVLPLLTRTFGSDLRLLATAEGKFSDFTVAFDIKTPRFTYDTLDLKNIALQGKVTGLPSTGHGNLKLDFLYNGIHASLNLASITLAEQILSLKDISLKGLLSSVQGHLTYNLETSEIAASLKGNISDLTPLTSLASLGKLPLAGTADINGHLKMYGAEPDSLRLKLQGKKLEGEGISIATLNIDLNLDDFLNIPTVKGTVGMTDIKSNEVTLDALTLHSHLEKGQGSLILKGHGKALTLEILSALSLSTNRQLVTLNTFKALYNKEPFNLEKPFTIEFFGDTVTVSPATFKIVTFPFTFQGKKQGEILDFSLKGETDLGVLSRLFLYTGDIVKGILSIDLTIAGTLNQLDYDGTLDLKKGYYENIIYGTKLHDLSFKAQAKDGLITLNKVKTRDGYGGYLSLNGTYDLIKKFFDFKADAVKMRFAYTDKLKIIAREGTLSIKGPYNNVMASGSLTMDEVAYNVTAAFSENVAELNVIDPSKPQQDAEEKLKANPKKSPNAFKLTFDFNIKIPPVFRIYGLGLDSLWEGELKVSKSLDDILIIGEIDLKEGELDFLGQTVEIDEGTLTFDGQEENIPYLALQASLKKNDFKAIIALNGRATKPSFAISSEPPLPQEEVLSQLLFGSHSSKLSPLSALKLAKVAGELAGVGGGGSFTDLMKDQLGKEEVNVEGGDNEKDALLKAKEALSDKVSVHLDQGVTPMDSKVVVEVEVTPKITVSTEAGAAKSSESVGVNYKWDY
ncbi:MAG: hypothetical protein GW748_05365 [Alphaproteobacteria bacterium]|nr:hypothetical protein [Alphaproteobacteria bacterium]NCQ67155.1 hypothetical protein [Alphaproteobacteria bacterium]NCT07751.1 hypothetical protein [Alphaproteobacteria bacterium]